VTIQLCKITLREVQHVMTPCSHVQQGKNKTFVFVSVCLSAKYIIKMLKVPYFLLLVYWLHTF